MDRLIDQIITLLTASVKTPRGIKKIYKGDIFLIPKASIPCIIVTPNRTEVRTKTNVQDNDIFFIDITVVLDARDYMNASATEFTGLFVAALIMEERKADTTNEVKADTILKTIRSGLDSSSDFSLRADCSIDYGFRFDREFPTIEANLQVQVLSKIYTR